MKKTFSVASMVLALCILLAGCGQSVVTPSATQAKTPAPTATPQSKELFLLPDWVAFGMSLDDVKAHYSIRQINNGSYDALRYAYPYKDYDPSYFRYEKYYQFAGVDNHLYAVTLVAKFDPLQTLDAETLGKKPIAEEYKSIKALLTSKFGKAASDSAEWKDKTYKNNSSKLSYAFAADHCTFKTIWYYGDYKVMLYNGILGIYIDFKLKDKT